MPVRPQRKRSFHPATRKNAGVGKDGGAIRPEREKGPLCLAVGNSLTRPAHAGSRAREAGEGAAAEIDAGRKPQIAHFLLPRARGTAAAAREPERRCANQSRESGNSSPSCKKTREAGKGVDAIRPERERGPLCLAV